MSPSNPEQANRDLFPIPGRPLNPAELKIDLLCRGMRVDGDIPLAREILNETHRQSGLESGLELIIPGERGDLWANVPVVENFVEKTPYHLQRREDSYYLFDQRQEMHYRVRLTPLPDWCGRKTARGIPMSRVAVLQGTCLSIYVGERCQFWSPGHPANCKFCASGLAHTEDELERTVDDVVETALAARRESRVTFVRFSSGYQGSCGLKKVFPYVEAIKQKVGLLVGVQFTPEQNLALYDQILHLGADHLSFCFEFYNAEYFRRYLPGKAEVIGRDSFFRALEYCAWKMGRGRVSGEIIAGVEPVKDTLRAIDYIAGVGAIPMVCIFRPLTGADMENYPAPAFSEMVRVFRHVYEACRVHNLPIGVAPNVNISLSLQPEEAFYLAAGTPADSIYQRWLEALKQILRSYFARRMRPKGV